MKKSLVALAVLAASGAAMAQSSVTLYGIADLWVGSANVDTGADSESATLMHSGGVSTSRWGMKGTEDLGGGLKANFQFEQSVAVDTGAASNFGRAAWVGFSGGFGAVRLGLTATPFDDVQGASDGVFDSDLAPAVSAGYGNVTKLGAKLRASGVFATSNDYHGKAANTIYYQAPNFNGFSGAFSYSLDEEDAKMPAITSLNLTYAAGPLAAQFAYQSEDLSTNTSNINYLRLGASYNFGVATAKFMFGKAENIRVTNTVSTSTADAFANIKGAETTEWQIGADMPISSAMTLSASYAVSEDNKEAGDTERSGFGMAVAYGLSKRTTLYGGFKMVKIDPIVGHDVDVTVFAAGVKHTF